MTARGELWICPPFDGPRTGGTIYNARLVDALQRRGARVDAVSLEEGRRALMSGGCNRAWVDSLYMGEIPELCRANVARVPLGLITHYLPSLVALGRSPSLRELTSAERTAISGVDGFLTTSPFLADVLSGLGVARAKVVSVTPGIDVDSARQLPRSEGSATLAASMVANLLPGKGIVPFLVALAPLARSGAFTLRVIGDPSLDPEYAAAARSLVDTTPSLRERVVFENPASHRDVIARVAASDVFVSASRMESFGMALAEARALGVPILVRRGGYAEAHVEARAGGEAFDDDRELASALVRLSCEPAEQKRRTAAARALRTSRSWNAAAREYLAHPRGAAREASTSSPTT